MQISACSWLRPVIRAQQDRAEQLPAHDLIPGRHSQFVIQAPVLREEVEAMPNDDYAARVVIIRVDHLAVGHRVNRYTGARLVIGAAPVLAGVPPAGEEPGVLAGVAMPHEPAIAQRLPRKPLRVAERGCTGGLRDCLIEPARNQTAGDGRPGQRAAAQGPAPPGVDGQGRWRLHGDDACTQRAVPARHVETITGPGTFPDWESWRSGLTMQVGCMALAWRTVCQWPPSRTIAVLRPAGGIC